MFVIWHKLKVHPQGFRLTFVNSLLFFFYTFHLFVWSCITFTAGLICCTFVKRIFSIGKISDLRWRNKIMYSLHANTSAQLQICYFLLDYFSSCFHDIQFPFFSFYSVGKRIYLTFTTMYI